MQLLYLGKKVPYINPKVLKKNICEKGAYTVNITSHDSNVTLIASGTEVELALKVQEKLKELNIHSKSRLDAVYGAI